MPGLPVRGEVLAVVSPLETLVEQNYNAVIGVTANHSPGALLYPCQAGNPMGSYFLIVLLPKPLLISYSRNAF